VRSFRQPISTQYVVNFTRTQYVWISVTPALRALLLLLLHYFIQSDTHVCAVWTDL